MSEVKTEEESTPSDETSEVEFEEIIPEDTIENVINGGETSDEPRDFETEENEPADEEGATVDDSANDTVLDLDKNEVISIKDGTRKKIQDGCEENRDTDNPDTKNRDADNPDTKNRDTDNPDTKSRDTKGETNKVRRIDTPETGDDGFAVAMVLLILSCSGLLVMAHRRNPES